jgi:hypothetical protein
MIINFFKSFYNRIFPLKKYCEYCHKSDKIEISYHDWCNRCKKLIIGEYKRKLKIL